MSKLKERYSESKKYNDEIKRMAEKKVSGSAGTQAKASAIAKEIKRLKKIHGNTKMSETKVTYGKKKPSLNLSGHETWYSEAKRHGDKKQEEYQEKMMKKDNAKNYLKRMVRSSGNPTSIAKNYQYKKGK